MSEAEAIRRAQEGDGHSFSALYTFHKRRVYSLCLRMTGNTAEAEDLTQEAFLQLYRKIGTFRGESAFSTWLHRLAVNVVLMHLRKKGLPEISFQEALEPAEEDGPKKDIGANDQTLTGSIDLSPDQLQALRKGQLYIQISSEKAPDGNLWGWLLR
jgi:RNA polymerase sigma-70 factor (ECF subfamily)